MLYAHTLFWINFVFSRRIPTRNSYLWVFRLSLSDELILVRACVYLACYSTTGHLRQKKHHKKISKCLNLLNKKGEDTVLIEFVSYLMKTECPHEWKRVSSVLHCLGWLLPRCACSEWQAFGTWELQPGTFSACGSGDCKLESLYTRRVQGFCLWVQQCRSAKGTRNTL